MARKAEFDLASVDYPTEFLVAYYKLLINIKFKEVEIAK